MPAARSSTALHTVVLAALCGLCLQSVASAEPGDLDFIDTTERDEDPLGIDVTTGRDLEQAAEALARREREQAAHPDLPTERGEVTSGIRPLRELSHETALSWEHGIQYVTERITLGSESRFAAEAAYRLALPRGARVLAVRLCEAQRCTRAEPGGDDAEPLYVRRLQQTAEEPGAACLASTIRDGRGLALALRVAPVRQERPLRVEVDYALEQPVRGGRVRLSLPARGYDARAAAARIEVRAPSLQLPALPEALRLDPWVPLELAAEYAPANGSQRHRMRAPCGPHTCERRWAAAAGTDTEAPVELWVLVDRSPSMVGPARGRVEAALSALAQRAPPGSRIRLGSFAATAGELSARPLRPDALPQAGLRPQLLDPGQARTRLSSGLALVLAHWAGRATHPPRLVVLTDARFSTGELEQRALARWRKEGVPSFVVNLSDARPGEARLKLMEKGRLQLLSVAEEAERAVMRGDSEPLQEALAGLIHGAGEPGSGAARPGEQVVRLRRLRAAPSAASLEEQRWLGVEPVRQFVAHLPNAKVGLAQRGSVLYVAEPYRSTPPPPAPPDTALPAESVLKMLRGQLLPKARACLRRDRRGRADYAVHATFHFLLERQEILEARVDGELQRPLRECLDDILAALRIPFFEGRVRVRYPIYTERAPVPPQIELAPETARQLDRLFERERPLR